jgi:iron complex transport system substrate-binding protein
VSLSPTATEILYAVGAGPQVVAVDEESSYPAEAPRTQLSGFEPNTEALATFRPDLVVYSTEPGDLGTSLEAIGVPGVYQPPAADLNDTYEQILELGAATGHRGEAESLVKEMKMQIEDVVGSLPRFIRPPSYYHELDENYFTATSKTYIGGIYGLLGLTNIADPADKQGGGYPQLSGEYIVQANPDFVFLADARCCGQSARTVAGRPGWDKIAAVQNGGVIELDDDIASRWGPRIVDFLRSAADALKSYQAAQQ